jgi:hypothetical protein
MPTAEHEDMRALSDGIAMASHVAAKCEVVMADQMTGKQAAEAMRTIIISALRAHADAIRHSAFEREREAEKDDE